eukprot:211455_1
MQKNTEFLTFSFSLLYRPEKQTIDIEQFLNDNKLDKLVEIFIERDITVEKLLEFDEEELKVFAKELLSDVVSQNRLVETILKLQSLTMPNKSATGVVESKVDIIQCQQHVLQCPSMKRIKIMLNTFDKYLQNNISNECKDELQKLIKETFNANDSINYKQLLNDFNHIKYYHDADDNHSVFAQIFQYLTQGLDTICSPEKCNKIQRHYHRQSKLVNAYTLSDYKDNSIDNEADFYHEYITNLITRMHVYFIHSYDINRLTLDEIDIIGQLPEEEKTTKTVDMMKQKKNKLNIIWQSKCIEAKDEG